MKITLTEKGLEYRRQAQYDALSELPLYSRTQYSATLSGMRKRQPSPVLTWGTRGSLDLQGYESLLQSILAANPPVPIKVRATPVRVSPGFSARYGQESSSASPLSPKPVAPSILSVGKTEPSRVRLANPLFHNTMPNFYSPLKVMPTLGRTASVLMARSLKKAKMKDMQRELTQKRQLLEARRKVHVRDRFELEHDPSDDRLRQLEACLTQSQPHFLKSTRKQRRERRSLTRRSPLSTSPKDQRLRQLATPLRGLIRVPYPRLKPLLPPEPARIDPIRRNPPVPYPFPLIIAWP